MAIPHAMAKRVRHLMETKPLYGCSTPLDEYDMTRSEAEKLIAQLEARPDGDPDWRPEGYRRVNAAPAERPAPTPGGNHSRQSAPLATDPQMSYLRKLIDERDYHSLVPADREKVDYVKGGGRPTKRGASALIDVLKATALATPVSSNGFSHDRQPAGRGGAPLPEVADGFYVVGDRVFKVVVAVHGSGHKYAKELDRTTGRFEYAKGVMRMIAAEGHTMTRADAARLGQLYGMCVRCGATLTAEDSIERFMGPVCYGNTIGD